MKYQEISGEYSSLLRELTEIQIARLTLADGYISMKKISGKEYAYLQYRIDGKLISKYIKSDQLHEVRRQLHERANLERRLTEIEAQLSKIERAAAILDEGLYRRLITQKRCALMDALSADDRVKTLAFGNAMTALEGLLVSSETEQNLLSWAGGSGSFGESFQKILKKYHLAEA